MSTQSLILGITVASLFMRSCSGDIEPAGKGSSRVKDLAAEHEFKCTESSDTGVTYGNGQTTISLLLNSRKLIFNDTLILMNAPATVRKRKWVISEADTAGTLVPLVSPHRFLDKMGSRLVVIDAGHGGSDSGALGKRGTKEKDVVLDIATRAKHILESRGVAVQLTRSRDTKLDLGTRPALAREWQADVFVSIHINSAANSKSRGAETYVLTADGYPSTAEGSKPRGMCPGNRFDPANTVLAYDVHRTLMKRTGLKDRGVKRARFEVLRSASCPSILVEAGFVSNPDEETRIRTDAYRIAAAEGIVEGILSYLSRVRKASRKLQPSK